MGLTTAVTMGDYEQRLCCGEPLATSTRQSQDDRWRPDVGGPSYRQLCTTRVIRYSLISLLAAVSCQSSGVTEPARSIEDFRAHLERLRSDGHIQAISAVI